MAFPKSYNPHAPTAANLAVPVDLAGGDFLVPLQGIIGAFPQPTSRVYVGVAGDLTVVMSGDGATVTFPSHPAGYAEISVTQILKAGTTASGLVALF